MLQIQDIPYDESWNDFFRKEFEKEFVPKLNNLLNEEYKKKRSIFPPFPLIFNAFKLCPFNETLKVVILGQDPYIQYDYAKDKAQAMGLSFSVPDGLDIPPSLVNIFREIINEFAPESEIDPKTARSGDLSDLAQQGVLLLNSTLTVSAGKSNSHAGVGWGNLTDDVIRYISENAPHPIIFALWGNFARAKKKLVNTSRHIILESSHPSPLSYNSGETPFKGNGHFKLINDKLTEIGLAPINWGIRFNQRR
jgi:uracil-DNA glycosylase